MHILVHKDKINIDAITQVINDAWELSDCGENGSIGILGHMSSQLGVDDLFIGAFNDEELVGFILAAESKRSSEMNVYLLGVKKEFQSGGIGYELLAASKDAFLEKGMTNASWTFDPFDTKCAKLYFHKLEGICSKYSKEPISISDPSCSAEFPARYFKVDWELEGRNLHKEKDYEKAVEFLPHIQYPNSDHKEFLIPITAHFKEKIRLSKPMATREFNRLDDLFNHYINKRGYAVVDFLHKPGEKKGFYKFRKK